MRVAKMDKADFKAVRVFTQVCEGVLEKEKFSFTSAETNWRSWDDDDEDKLEILRIRKDVAIDEGCDEKEVDDRIVMYEFLKSKYTHRLQLAIMTAEVLIDNVCDVTKDYLDYRPSLQQIHVEAEQ